MSGQGYIFYNKTTGEITRRYDGGHPEAQHQEVNEVFMVGRFDDADYRIDVSDPAKPVAVLKTSVGAVPNKVTVRADAVDLIVFSAVPAGTKVSIHGDDLKQGAVVNDGILELTFDTEGEYRAHFHHPLYLDQDITINAT